MTGDDGDNVGAGLDALTARTRSEVEGIVAVVGALTGLPSRWSGRVEILLEARYKGRKPFNCDILIAEDVARREERWRTLIHEALHAHSVGYNGTDYRALRGWEEGVVEHLQRLLRPTVLSRLQVAIAEDVFRSA